MKESFIILTTIDGGNVLIAIDKITSVEGNETECTIGLVDGRGVNVKDNFVTLTNRIRKNS